VNLNRARCLIVMVSREVGSLDISAYFGMFQFFLPADALSLHSIEFDHFVGEKRSPFNSVSFWLTQMPVILISVLSFSPATAVLKYPGKIANSSCDPTGVSLYQMICAKQRPPVYWQAP